MHVLFQSWHLISFIHVKRRQLLNFDYYQIDQFKITYSAFLVIYLKATFICGVQRINHEIRY